MSTLVSTNKKTNKSIDVTKIIPYIDIWKNADPPILNSLVKMPYSIVGPVVPTLVPFYKQYWESLVSTNVFRNSEAVSVILNKMISNLLGVKPFPWCIYVRPNKNLDPKLMEYNLSADSNGITDTVKMNLIKRAYQLSVLVTACEASLGFTPILVVSSHLRLNDTGTPHSVGAAIDINGVTTPSLLKLDSTSGRVKTMKWFRFEHAFLDNDNLDVRRKHFMNLAASYIKAKKNKTPMNAAMVTGAFIMLVHQLQSCQDIHIINLNMNRDNELIYEPETNQDVTVTLKPTNIKTQLRGKLLFPAVLSPYWASYAKFISISEWSKPDKKKHIIYDPAKNLDSNSASSLDVFTWKLNKKKFKVVITDHRHHIHLEV